MVMLLARSSGGSIVAYIECDVKVQTGRLRPREGGLQMPIVKIHVLDGRYDERRLGNVMIQLSEFPGENFSFGQGLAQRAFISQETREA